MTGSLLRDTHWSSESDVEKTKDQEIDCGKAAIALTIDL